MKIVKNSCYGGYGLSPKAVKRLAELQGKECYFFDAGLSYVKTHKRKPLTLDEASKTTMMLFTAFSVPNPDEVLPECKPDKDGRWKTYNEQYEKIEIGDMNGDRTNPFLIQVVEELKEEANWQFAKLVVVEIPDGIEWEISEYDGYETVEEKHRSW